MILCVVTHFATSPTLQVAQIRMEWVSHVLDLGAHEHENRRKMISDVLKFYLCTPSGL